VDDAAEGRRTHVQQRPAGVVLEPGEESTFTWLELALKEHVPDHPRLAGGGLVREESRPGEERAVSRPVPAPEELIATAHGEHRDTLRLRTPDGILRAIVDPESEIRYANRSIRAVTRDGTVITGRRMNEDTYTVQLIDEQEKLVSLVKSNLREYGLVRRTGMPSYRDKLSNAEVADVLAYLLSLKGL